MASTRADIISAAARQAGFPSPGSLPDTISYRVNAGDPVAPCVDCLTETTGRESVAGADVPRCPGCIQRRARRDAGVVREQIRRGSGLSHSCLHAPGVA